MNAITFPKIKKRAIVLISVGFLNFVHGMLHVVQFIQSIMLVAYSTQHHHHPESMIDKILHHPVLAFVWAIIGLLTFVIGVRDFKHHRKCDAHKHE